ncbi:MAG: 5-oxoprolinase/urea amidolyase family protein, partial [Acetobacteraceae bacterium]|nr:5-oxoprolinase/urea amidolyase family protein [Acetobacteraceae bacterium]
GAVALAGPFSGIYPRESPGGWQIIGTAALVMFDLGRERPALLQPGDRVRFQDLDQAPAHTVASPEPTSKPATTADAGPAANEARGWVGLRVLAVGAPVLFQDFGRSGLARQGVSASGALDRAAFVAANRLVGNPPSAACLEITLGSLSFAAEQAAVVALTGAPAPITIRTAADRVITAPHARVIRLEAGDTVSLAAPSQGMRSYLAVQGGFAVTPVLGSAATDTLSGLGPSPVAAGDTLVLNPAPRAVAESHPPAPRRLPSAKDIVTLDVIMGPRTDWFTPDAVRAFAGQEWLVIPQSSRVGIRLQGKQPLVRAIDGELPSEGTIPGAIQVPPSGQPVLFLADHPLTGGYPVIASVAPYHLDLAAQIPIGARIRFNPVRPFEEISPLRPRQPGAMP